MEPVPSPNRTADPAALVAEDRQTRRLVERFHAGDDAAFEAIYRRYLDRVRVYALSKLGDPADADELTQEVFAAVRTALPRYLPIEGKPFRAWLFVIARNHIVARRRRHDRATPTEPFKLELVRAIAESAAGIGSGDWIDHDELLALVERLPLAQRQVLMLRYVLDRSVAETAHILDRTSTDVTTTQSHALRALRQGLTESGWAARFQRGETRRVEAPFTRRTRVSPVTTARRRVLAPPRRAFSAGA